MMLYRVIYENMDYVKAMESVFEIWKPHDQWEEFITLVLSEKPKLLGIVSAPAAGYP